MWNGRYVEQHENSHNFLVKSPIEGGWAGLSDFKIVDFSNVFGRVSAAECEFAVHLLGCWNHFKDKY